MKTNPAQMLASTIEAMRSPDFELDTDEAGAVITCFNIARAHNVPLGDFTPALIDVLKRQLAATFADVDGEADADDEPDPDGEDGEDDFGDMTHDPNIAGGNHQKARQANRRGPRAGANLSNGPKPAPPWPCGPMRTDLT